MRKRLMVIQKKEKNIRQILGQFQLKVLQKQRFKITCESHKMILHVKFLKLSILSSFGNFVLEKHTVGGQNVFHLALLYKIFMKVSLFLTKFWQICISDKLPKKD